MNQARLASLVFAVLGVSLLLWLSYDASAVALTLGLESNLGEAGVALLGLYTSSAMLLVAAVIPLRARFGRHGGTDRGTPRGLTIRNRPRLALVRRRV